MFFFFSLFFLFVTDLEPLICAPIGSITRQNKNQKKKKFLSVHLFKRYLWSVESYPNFSQRCVVCQDREVEVAFIGCGHAVTCGDCGRMCLYGNHSSSGLCPLCRAPIEVLTDDTLSRKDR